MTGVTYGQESSRLFNLLKEWPLTPSLKGSNNTSPGLQRSDSNSPAVGGEPCSVSRGDGDAGHRKPEAANVEKVHFVVDGLKGNIFIRACRSTNWIVMIYGSRLLLNSFHSLYAGSNTDGILRRQPRLSYSVISVNRRFCQGRLLSVSVYKNDPFKVF